MCNSSHGPGWLKSAEAQKELRVDGCDLMHLRVAGELGFKKEGNAYLYARQDVNRVKKRRINKADK